MDSKTSNSWRLFRRENDSLSDLLAHLAELDQRELCVALGYSSLFAYCTEAQGFCKSSAGRRIAAARVCREFPEAFARVAQGELHLSVLCALRPHLNAQNAAELFALCSRKSYEQVETLLRKPRRLRSRPNPPRAVSSPDDDSIVKRTRHVPAAEHAQCTNATKAAAPFALKMAGVAMSGACCSSITSFRTRRAASKRQKIYGCAVGRTTCIRLGCTLVAPI